MISHTASTSPRGGSRQRVYCLVMLLARAWLLSLAQLIAASSQLTVELGVAGLGDLLGSMSRTAWSARPIYQFQGVPYAKSPGRHNRFKVHCYSCRTSSRILNIKYNLCRMRLIPKSVYVDCSSYLTCTSVNSRPSSHNFLVQRRVQTVWTALCKFNRHIYLRSHKLSRNQKRETFINLSLSLI